ncbi:MAG TPA: imidazole glycerol phosphate synthase subunit HisH [Kiritimatiellia bacterium]|nr:imidazole glycerol phosphate synthase subunit HisH [Kiritimatiellia bacterium]
MIGVVDYGMGNLGSVLNACRFLGWSSRVVTQPEEIEGCEGLILPGVGAFGDCMRHLEEHGLSGPVKGWIDSDRPFLGICLGLQVLFEGSEESPGVPGLGVFKGMVRRFPPLPGLKVPQIGWNRISWNQPDHRVTEGIPSGAHVYFVHSYYVDNEDAGLTLATTEYGVEYTSAIARGRLAAVQFHPEKSQKVGLRILRNFGACCGAPMEAV